MNEKADSAARRLADLEAALDALARLVFAEYPDGYSLAQIAERWGVEFGITPEQVDALRRLEAENGSSANRTDIPPEVGYP